MMNMNAIIIACSAVSAACYDTQMDSNAELAKQVASLYLELCPQKNEKKVYDFFEVQQDAKLQLWELYVRQQPWTEADKKRFIKNHWKLNNHALKKLITDLESDYSSEEKQSLIERLRLYTLIKPSSTWLKFAKTDNLESLTNEQLRQRVRDLEMESSLPTYKSGYLPGCLSRDLSGDLSGNLKKPTRGGRNLSMTESEKEQLMTKSKEEKLKKFTNKIIKEIKSQPIQGEVPEKPKQGNYQFNLGGNLGVRTSWEK